MGRASENSSRGRNTEDKHKRNRKQRTTRRMRINMRVIERGGRQTDIDSAADKEVYTEAVVAGAAVIHYVLYSFIYCSNLIFNSETERNRPVI